MSNDCNKSAELNGGTPLAGVYDSATEIIEDLIRACGAGMNWMDQVSRAKLGSATRGILNIDMGLCSCAIFRARQYLEKAKSPNGQALLPARSQDQKGNDAK